MVSEVRVLALRARWFLDVGWCVVAPAAERRKVAAFCTSN